VAGGKGVLKAARASAMSRYGEPVHFDWWDCAGSASHWGVFPWPRVGTVESFDGEFIPDPDRECGLSAQGAASERQLRHGSQRVVRDVTWQKLDFGPYLP
jgi:hypothetical protein